MRFGLRYLLPPLLLSLYIILVISGERQREVLTPDQAWMREYMEITQPMPLSTKIAIGINLPALFPAVPIVLSVNAFAGEWQAHHIWVSYAVFGIFVSGLWYLVGLGVDKKLRFIPVTVPKPRRFIRLWWAVLGFVAVVSAAGLAGGHLRYRSGWTLIASLCWSVFGMILLHARPWRKDVKQ